MRSSLPSAFLCALLLLAGCATGRTEGQRSLHGLAGGLDTLAVELDRAGRDVDDALERHDALVRGGEEKLSTRFGRYVHALDDLEDRREGLRKRVDAIEGRATSYFDRWAAEIEAIENDRLRAASTTQRDARETRYEELREQLDTAIEVIGPLLGGLREHVTYLSNNLTSASVAELARPGDELREAAGLVKEDLSLAARRTRVFAAELRDAQGR